MAEERKKSETAFREEKVLSFWNEQKIFEKSLEKKAPKGEFVFYDGPPFATGLPHYGHLLAGTIKDVFPRYKTMRGYRVKRRWGWDCHGLPIENLVEKELGLKSKKDIEEFGIERFNEAARASVLRYADEWKKVVPRFGRWVDMEHDYRTMNPDYTESVWWVFATLHRKGLVYEGFKAMHLCPRCGTTLSNFEVALGYRDITDFAVTVKLELDDEPGTYLLAWTTTPWTLPGNMAAAVKSDFTYVGVRTDEGLLYVAQERVNDFFENPKIEREIRGAELVGKAYTPPFPYYQDRELENKNNAWKVYAAEYVTTEDGTGIVHLAPAYGAEDLELAQREHIPIVHHVGKDGAFMPEVIDFAGMQAKPKDATQATDVEIIKYLAHAGVLFKKEKITHSYPLCWRCETPLLNYATNSWFVEVTRLRDQLVKQNRKVVWIPPEVGEKRFGDWLEGARDWAISRLRYWGAPFPVWQSPETGAATIVGSLDELKAKVKKSGNAYFIMRHGESEKNEKGIVSSDRNKYPLTKKGKETVLNVANSLVSKNIDLIITSPVLRARETAQVVAEILTLPADRIVEDERITERGHGVFEERPSEEYYDTHPKGLPHFDHAPEGAETWSDVRKRMGDFLYDIEQRYQNKNILIVSHGDPLTLMRALARGLSREQIVAAWDALYPKTGEAVTLPFVPLPHNRDYELDFHRPYIDEVKLVDVDGRELQRIPDVFDGWFESGAMPYAEKHYPFEKEDPFDPKGGLFKRRSGFPADFIAEGLDQTRGWFYSLLVLGVAIFGKSPYKNVIVNGLVLAEDGKKMSKSLKNYPDPMDMVERYGADAVRYYMIRSPIVCAEDLRFTEKDVAEVSSKLIGRLVNVLSLYELYKDSATHEASASSSDVLDRWILSRLSETARAVEGGLDAYKLDRAARPLLAFVDDLSTWYARRSRNRLKGEGAAQALGTLRFVLRQFALVAAPFVPFVAEHVFFAARNEKDPESVHLCGWPVFGTPDDALLFDMATVRDIVSRALEARARANIKVRQPLQTLFVHSSMSGVLGNEMFVSLIKDEVNVKELIETDDPEKDGTLDTNITPELAEEGGVRELVRTIQDLRKKANLSPKDQAVLFFAEDTALLEKYWEAVSRTANLSRFEKAAETHVEKF